MQWTIDPGLTQEIDGREVKVSLEVCGKAVRAYEAGVVVRSSRRGFVVPSWTNPLKGYPVIITADPDHEDRVIVLKAVCACDSTGHCHHGYAAALKLLAEDFPGYRLVARHPNPRPARRTKRSRPLTVIPGGRA